MSDAANSEAANKDSFLRGIKQRDNALARICCYFVFLMWLPALFTDARAQDSATFERAHEKIYKEVAQKDLNLALAMADSLYQASRKPVFRIRSLVLIAGLYQQKEDLENAIGYGEKAEKLAGEVADYAWQVRANGLLAGQYRMMGLYNKSRVYSKKALDLVPFIKDAEKANSTRGLLLQELAFGSKDEDNYRQAIRYLEEAGMSFNLVKNNRDFMVMNNERLIGDNYRLLESYDTALIHYRKALALSSGSPAHHTTGFLYRGIAEALLEKGSLKEAKDYVDKAVQFANQSQYLQLKESVYATAKKYYDKVKDQEQSMLSGGKRDSVTGVLLDKRANLLDKTYLQLEKRGVKAEELSHLKTVVIVAVLLLFISAVTFFVVYRKKKRKELAQFESILEQLRKKEAAQAEMKNGMLPVVANNHETSAPVMVVASDSKEDKKEEEKRIMTMDTELKLLKGMEDFEESDLYLDNELSFTLLATRLNTNTKYLSYLIKTHKKTDFNSYINKLRIDYIVEKLKNNPDWRQYKISALATTAGFSSHSQFAAIFKTFTGLSPSIFIRHLNKDGEG